MKTFFKSFADSAKEFTNLRSLITAALLIAIRTILAIFLAIPITDSLRISISFVADVVIGAFFGPVMGFVCGGLGDIVQFVIKPTGAFNPGLTLNSALAGLIFGLFFYKRFPITSRKEDKKQIALYLRIASALIPIVGIVLNFKFAFVKEVLETVFDEDKNPLDTIVHLQNASLIEVLKCDFSVASTRTIFIVAILAVVVALTLVVLAFLPNNIPAFLVSSFGISLCILAVYTDRKTTLTGTGFSILMACFGIYLVLQLVQIAVCNSMDLKFLILSAIAMFVYAVIINMLLGTYWISQMIGTPFAVLFVPRTIKNIIQLPINIILSYYVLFALKPIYQRMFGNKNADK